MDSVLKPFIGIYHIVKKVISSPKTLFNKIKDASLGRKDKKELNKSKKENTLVGMKPVNGQAPRQNQEQEPVNENLVGLKNAPKAKKAPDRPLNSYRYVVVNSQGKQEKGTFEAETISDVKNFLISQDYKVLDVVLRKPYDIDIFSNSKLSSSDLAFSLTQLSTYIKAGIPLVDAVRILAKQASKPAQKKAFEKLVYELLKGENLSDAMEKQGKSFPKLLINMVKTAEMTGDLPSILDDMSDYYTSMEQTRKQMISAMTYPVVVLVIAFVVLIFMLTYLVPQFAGLYADNDASLPALTLAILNISDFIKANYIIIIIVVIIMALVFRYLFKNIKSFRKAIQSAMMHIPVIKDIIIYNEVANFTNTFASLLNHGVYITDSMEILSKITKNEVYKDIIAKCLNNLAKGDSISSSFKGEWAFPVVAYEMLVTGESTGQLGLMMEKVAKHFQSLHKNVIDQMKSLMEPLLICFLALIVGVILLSIIQPMFGIYEQVQ